MDEKKPKVTTDMLIGEIIVKYPDAAFALMQCGMGCIGCPSSRGESIGEAAAVHGLNADILVHQINDFLGVENE